MSEEAQSTFDLSGFLTTSSTDAMESEFKPIPEGDYLSVIVGESPYELSVRPVQTKDGMAHVMDVNCKIDDPGNSEADGKVVRYSCWLDLEPTGAFTKGDNKNVKLGVIRSALGQNVPGVEWSPSMMVGQAIRISVKHSKDGKYANVETVASAQ